MRHPAITGNWLLDLIIGVVVVWLLFEYVIPKLPEPVRTPAYIVVAILVIYFLLRLIGIV